MRRSVLLAGCCAVLTVVLGGQTPPVAGRPELVALFDEVQKLREPRVVDGFPDYTASAVEAQRRGLRALQARLHALDPTGWPTADAVDYLLVRSELDMLDYGLHVYRPTSRSPNFYLSAISSFGLSSGATLSRLGRLVMAPPPFDPTRGRAILDQMRAIPRILDQAKANLTEPTQEMSRWALPTLDRAEQSSQAFADGLAPHFPAADVPALQAAARDMGRALASYRQWIEQRLPTMAHATPVGRELYDWVLRRIWLLPYTADTMLEAGEREYARYLSFSEYETVRNRSLPPLAPAGTTAEYASRTEADEKRIRAFLRDKNVLTVPDVVGPYRRTAMPPYIVAFSLWAGLSGYRTPDGGDMKYSVPEDHPYTKTYWEAVMRVDPSTNIFHDGIPGHFFQGVISARHPSPIRRRHTERFKSEGWSTYWEEAGLQLGYYDDRPRSRELVYNFLRLRALRVIIDVKMALGELTPDQAVEALMSVPMDRRIASEEADDFFAAPTGGTVYLIGKLQIEDLLKEERRRLGAAFDLRAFHDRIVEAAWVPLELTRWEMTGVGDRARAMLADRTPMPGRR